MLPAAASAAASAAAAAIYYSACTQAVCEQTSVGCPRWHMYVHQHLCGHRDRRDLTARI